MKSIVSRSYTKEFKQEAVRLALNAPSIAGVASDIGIPEATLYCWVTKAKQRGEVSSQTGSGPINIGEVVNYYQLKLVA
jgi:transposase-like protein